MDLHQAQLEILRRLLFNPHSRFSDLNKLGLTSDHLNYHVRELVKLKLITKTAQGYLLTDIGKEEANRIEPESTYARIEKQPKVGIVCHVLKGSDYTSEMVVQTRLKEPFYGFQGAITGKVKFGETIWDTAKRETEEETDLTGDFVYHGVVHHVNFKDGQIVEDKILFSFSCFNAQGNLLSAGEGFSNTWMTLKEYQTQPKIYQGELDIIAMNMTGKTNFIEVVQELNEF